MPFINIGGLHISTRQITLFSSRNNTCFYVEFPVDNDVCDQSPRTFTIQLMSAPDPEYTVIFLQQTITVKIDDGKVFSTSLSPSFPLPFSPSLFPSDSQGRISGRCYSEYAREIFATTPTNWFNFVVNGRFLALWSELDRSSCSHL